MRYIFALLFLAGCGGSLQDEVTTPETPSIATTVPDPFGCWIDGQSACHCMIPEHSADAIARMGERCNYLRSLAADLY